MNDERLSNDATDAVKRVKSRRGLLEDQLHVGSPVSSVLPAGPLKRSARDHDGALIGLL